MITTQALANQLIKVLKVGDFNGAYDLFDQESAKHYEPKSQVEAFRNIVGIQAIKEKDQVMGASIVKAGLPEISNIVVKPGVISLNYKMRIELQDGSVLNLDEIIVYEVDNGKIISENIFY